MSDEDSQNNGLMKTYRWQRKWGKLQLLNDPSQINADSPHNVRHDINIQCRNKEGIFEN
jgi:hypothetical protein